MVSWELYELTADPAEQHDLAAARQEVVDRLSNDLAALRWQPVADSLEQMLTMEDEEELKALGYLQ
jgi:hypothetical protein